MKEPSYVRETLAWCNRQRVKRGKDPLAKLPKGVRRVPNSCPCGKATGLAVFEDMAEDFSNGTYVKVGINRFVRRFVEAFDNGDLPQYEMKQKS
jgi:hypothetical protein